MIVSTMTLSEIYAQIKSDKDFLIAKNSIFFENQWRRFAMKATRFPCIKTTEVTSPKTRITYTIRLWSFTHSQWKNPRFVWYVKHVHEGGTTVYSTTVAPDMSCPLNVYTPHFLARYKERIMKDETKTLDEVINDLFLYNNHTIDHKSENLESLIKEDEKYYSGDNIHFYGQRSIDGIIISEVSDENPLISVHNTIVSTDLFTKSQNENSIISEWGVRLRSICDRAPTRKYSLEKQMDELVDSCDKDHLSMEDANKRISSWLDKLENQVY